MKARPAGWSGQVLAYALFGIAVYVFSVWPSYEHVPPGQALVKMSFSHAGEHERECKVLSPEELAKLAPNMRKPVDCPRRRVPVSVELLIDDEMVYRGDHEPTGLWGDGPSVVYRKFLVPAGTHRLEVRIRDSRDGRDFDYTRRAEVTLSEHQNLVVGFRPDLGGIRIR